MTDPNETTNADDTEGNRVLRSQPPRDGLEDTDGNRVLRDAPPRDGDEDTEGNRRNVLN